MQRFVIMAIPVPPRTGPRLPHPSLPSLSLSLPPTTTTNNPFPHGTPPHPPSSPPLFLKLSSAFLPHPRLRHHEQRPLTKKGSQKASPPGCWNRLVAQLHTTCSHQPGLGLRQPCAGHGTLCWVTTAPSAWLCDTRHVVVLGIAVRSRQGDNHVRCRSCCARPTAFPEDRVVQCRLRLPSYDSSQHHDTVPPVP